MTVYNEDSIPDPQHPILLLPGEKPIIFWFHDESTFHANMPMIADLCIGLVQMSILHHSIKGGNTFMVADYVCAQFRWLQGKNG
jgi:hypothetical protein